LSSLGQVEEAVAALQSALDNTDGSDLPQLTAIGLQILSDAAERLPETAVETKMSISRVREQILQRSAAGVPAADHGTEEEIDLYQRIAAETPDSALPALAGKLRDRAWQLREQGDITGALRAAEDAIKISRRLAEVSEDTYGTHLAYALVDHASFQADLAEQTGDAGMLNAAADDLESALKLLPTASGDRARLLVELAGLRLRIADQTGDDQFLEMAIDDARAATQFARGDDQSRVSALVILGQAALSRFQRTGDIGGVTLAIDSMREALAATPVEDPFWGTLQGIWRTLIQVSLPQSRL
jgi:tetratricopeptide (TPR) repeat protein